MADIYCKYLDRAREQSETASENRKLTVEKMAKKKQLF